MSQLAMALIAVLAAWAGVWIAAVLLARFLPDGAVKSDRQRASFHAHDVPAVDAIEVRAAPGSRDSLGRVPLRGIPGHVHSVLRAGDRQGRQRPGTHPRAPLVVEDDPDRGAARGMARQSLAAEAAGGQSGEWGHDAGTRLTGGRSGFGELRDVFEQADGVLG